MDDLMVKQSVPALTEEPAPLPPANAPSWKERLSVCRRWPELCSIAFFVLAGLGALAVSFVVLYSHYRPSPVIERLKEGPLAYTTNIYAAPRVIRKGDAVSLEELADQLKQSGYGSSADARVGYFTLTDTSLEVHPGRNSYFRDTTGRIVVRDGKVAEISLAGGEQVENYSLEPRLISNVNDGGLQQRRLVRYAEIPKTLVQAVVSIEDKRFFQHGGFDLPRIMKAAYVDLREGRKEQGASTLSMQLTRSLWLDRDKSWTRKFQEFFLTYQLEERLSKEQIFEHYSNEIYLGRLGTYSIHGFGAAAQAILGKDIRKLSLPEAALLAGIIQRPSYFNPYRNPAAALQRRAVVLTLMRDNGYITEEQRKQAASTPLQLAQRTAPSPTAPYYVDLVMEEMQSRLHEGDQASVQRIYTTLDLDLQRVAEDAVRTGMEEVDKRLKGSAKRPQVAMVVLDPHTGEIKALVGGRNYAASQLNRSNALRQPGSVFKPFVYAAALETGVTGGPAVITPGTTVVDEATTFNYRGEIYEPSNFHQDFSGPVTLRRALMKSLNIPAVKVAELAGLDRVVKLAERAGLEGRIGATPSLALGSYDVTPLQMAGAYTIFANAGRYEKPRALKRAVDADGTERYSESMEEREALDPRVSYIMVSFMQDVVRGGTAAGLWGRGVRVPVAAKTGTSRDGWFAGFTSNLLCVVWVGNDDGSELGLEGSKSAMPVWAEFMKQALKLPGYKNAKDFEMPSGLTRQTIDPTTGMLANEYCPEQQAELFIEGTETKVCDQHSAYRFLIRTGREPSKMGVPWLGTVPVLAPAMQE